MKANDFFEDAKRLFVEGKLKESISTFTKAADAGYDRKTSYLSRGAAYLKLQEADAAIADLSQSSCAREEPICTLYRKRRTSKLRHCRYSWR